MSVEDSLHDAGADEAFASYLQALERGEAVNTEAFLAAHADVADELRRFFQDRERFATLARPLDAGAEPPPPSPAGDSNAETLGADAPVQLDTGKRVRYFGDYELLDEIARGGMGVVYKARQVSLNRVVALKMILAGQVATPADVQRFRTEAEAAASLDHPNIVPIYEVGEHEGQHYFSMKFVEGPSLAARSRDGAQALSPRDAAKLLATVARAIHHAHQRKILHRDVKPGNLLLDANGEPLVTDFGLAKRVEGASDVTRTGAIVGTPSYMAPEQARAEKLLSTGVDVYSLGAILYELLTGRPPFKAATPLDTVLQVLEKDPDPPRKLNPRLDRDLETICLKCLEKDPAQRYGSAEALADELDCWQRGEPITARPSTAREKLVKWSKRNPALAGLIATGSLAAVTLLVFGVWFTLELETARSDAERARESADKQRLVAEGQRAAAESARDEAERRRTQLEDAQREVEAAQAENRRQQVRTMVENGTRQLNEGDLPAALLWWAEALHQDRDPAQEQAHRVRLASVGRQCPKLRQTWFQVTFGVFSADGRILAMQPHESHHPFSIWNVETGELAAPLLPVSGWVHEAALSADGRRLFTIGSERKEVELWDTVTGQALAAPLRHVDVGRLAGRYLMSRPLLLPALRAWHPDDDERMTINKAAFSPDGRRVITCSIDSTAQLWEVETGKRVCSSLRHPANVIHASFSPHGRLVVTASADGTARVWNSMTGEMVLQLPPGVIQATFSPDSRRVATVTYDGIVRTWQVNGGQPVSSPMKHGVSVRQADFSPDGRWVLTVADNRAARVWDATTGEPIGLPLRHSEKVNHGSFSPDGTRVVTASEDRTARVWDAATGEPLSPPLRHAIGVLRAAFSPDGSRVLTTSYGWDPYEARGEARVWELPQRSLAAQTLKHGGPVNGAWFSADGRLVLTASEDRTSRLWDVATGQELKKYTHQTPVRHACFSPDGRYIATATYQHAYVWSTSTDEQPRQLLLHPNDPNGVNQVHFSPDSSRLLTAGVDHVGRVWDVATGKEVIPPLKQTYGVEVAEFSSDGQLVATNDWLGTRLWSAKTGEQLHSLPHRHGVSNLAFSTDGRLLVTACSDQTARIWDTRTGQPSPHPLMREQGLRHGGVVAMAAFNMDGTRVVTASWDYTARVWDAATGKPITPTLKHAGPVHFAAFGPNGKWVVTASEDATARAWDAATGQPLTIPLLHPSPVKQAVFSPDGRIVLTACADGCARLWNLEGGERPIEDIRRLASLLTGKRIDPASGFVPLDSQEFRERWRAHREKWPGDFFTEPQLKLARHRQAAEIAEKSRRWADAIPPLDVLIKAAPFDGELLARRGRCHAELAAWDQAAADFTRCFELGNRDRAIIRQLALAHLAADDRAGYLRACSTAVRYLGQGDDPDALCDTARVFALLPRPAAELETPRQLAERAAKLSPGSCPPHHQLGAVLYRMDKPAEAVKTIQRAIELCQNSGRKGTPSDWLFLAMAHHRLGNAVEAEKWFAQAVLWCERDQGATLKNLPWDLRLEIRLLCRQAEELFGKKPAGADDAMPPAVLPIGGAIGEQPVKPSWRPRMVTGS